MPRRGRGRERASESDHSINQDARREREKQLFARVDSEKWFSIERLKAL